MSDSSRSAPVKAAHADTLLDAALEYNIAGLSVISLKGKRPSLKSWSRYQTTASTPDEIRAWHENGLLHNVGIVCGEISGKLVVLDFDGLGAYGAFAALFPALVKTYTVRTGSGQGKHVYITVESELPSTVKAMATAFGNIELRSNGSQVVAPPSIHPVIGNPYEVEKSLDVLHVPDLDEVVAWIESLQNSLRGKAPTWRPPRDAPPADTSINPAVGAPPVNP